MSALTEEQRRNTVVVIACLVIVCGTVAGILNALHAVTP